MAKMALHFRALCTCLVVALALCCEPLRCRASKPWEDKQKNVSSSLEFHTPKEVHEVYKESLKSFDYRVDTQSNSSRRDLHGLCRTGNSIDGCWRCDPHWATNRQSLANCALGFGSQAIGGRDGNLYVVTDDSDDDVINPKPGTLRYGVIQTQPLWIIFSANMNIRLQEELLMNSYKTVDGRGHNVHISGGACFVLQFISHVIIHGVHIHDCVSTGPAMVRSSPSHFGYRGKADGDGVSIFGSSHIWVDHCYLSNCADGLIDAIELSSAITVTNNYFTNHDKVMLLGAHPGDTFDKAMQVTVAFNHFGPGLIQRMPRCRFGYFHVVNNLYTQWEMYAIGGSENPTILSEGNVFMAPNNEYTKEVTKHIDDDGGTARNWQSWNWVSSGDLFLNGAFFTPSGSESISSSYYTKATTILAQPARRVPRMTRDAGPLRCNRGVLC